MSEVSPLLKTRSRPLYRAKRRLAFARIKEGPVRSPRHLAHVATLPCCVCGKPGPSEVHHPRVPGTDACGGRKCSDSMCVPMDAEHHRGRESVHGRRGEAVQWGLWGLDPLAIGAEVWVTSPVNAGEMP